MFWVYDQDRLSIDTLKSKSYMGLELPKYAANEAEFWLAIGYMWTEII